MERVALGETPGVSWDGGSFLQSSLSQGKVS